MADKPLFGIFDDYGNQLNKSDDLSVDNGIIKGDSPNSVDGKKYPKGFTPDVDFYLHPDLINDETGLPVEYGTRINSTGLDGSDPNDRLADRKDIYDKFKDKSGKEFTHNLDTLSTGELRSITTENTQSIYLGSFIESNSDNEDPTLLGYDLIIDYISSPLFNGSIEDFISQFSQYSEIASRGPILEEFKTQFFKYFKSHSPVSSGSPENVKTYYLRKLSGLENLVEQNTSDKVKSFVDYGKDLIGLSLSEDVTMNMGYLSTLYKSLVWSRINGKQLIPSNLLRFDVKIVITEIRKFNRVMRDQVKGTVSEYADLLSKYNYTLHECQFFFPKMPHGSDLNMTDTKFIEEFDITFDYKFSTLKFERFQGTESTFIDNSKIDPKQIRSNETDNATIDNNGIKPTATVNKLNLIKTWNSKTKKEESQDKYDSDTENGTNFANEITLENMKPTLASNIDTLKTRLKNAVVKEVNRQITNQARLLNRTLDNIRNSIGIGRMSEPTNVYEGYYSKTGSTIEPDVKNAFRGFLGQSVRGFFQDP